MTRLQRRLLQTVLPLAAIVGGTRIVSRAVVFPGAAPVYDRAPVAGDFERIQTRARDGVDVHLLELRAREPALRTIVYFHNNRDTIEVRADLARALAARGFGVVLVEYRGYGASRESGRPSEEGLYADAEAALDVLRARGVAPSDIVLWGTSLGTGVAAEMARRGHGARLVLETPYTSIPDLVTDRVPFAPASLLVPDHFDTLAKARDIAVPTLVVHGDDDEVVPHWMGARLAREIPSARLRVVAGGRHSDLFVRERDQLLAEIAAHAI